LPGARTAGAAGAAVAADVKKEKISAMAIALICFLYEEKDIEASKIKRKMEIWITISKMWLAEGIVC
jgi:hypothetical protein